MEAWQLEHGKMPSENGGGGTSRRSGTVGLWGFWVPSAASRTSANSGRRIPCLRTAQLHHALDLTQPHRLEELQPLADNARQVHRYCVAGSGVGRKETVKNSCRRPE